MEEEDPLFYPFASHLDWKVVCWAVQEGIGHKAFDRLLAIPGVREHLGLQYHNIRSLHQTIDSIPAWAKWQSTHLSFHDKPQHKHELHYRNPLDAIQALLGNPAHARDIVYKPSTIFSDSTHSTRIYNEMWSGRWWHAVQGAYVALVIIASNKTQLTRYLSVDKVLKEELSVKEASSRTQRLFHESLCIILEPLKEAGRTGVEITGGDGLVRLVFPIIAYYVADYPEQFLAMCSKYGTCPKCKARADQLAEVQQFAHRTQSWTTSVINEANTNTNSNAAFCQHCMAQDIAGGVFELFWLDFPLCNIHLAITSDNGWSGMGQIGGKERKHMARVLLGCLIGKVPGDVIQAYCSLLDFIYLAHYPTHDDTTLQYMQKALEDFHQHKEVIINLGVREDLDIPKFHSLQHYLENIKNFGTTDNYNIEMFERNEKPQMIAWLTRREKVSSFQSYLKMSMEDEEEEFAHSMFGDQRLLLTKRPHQARCHILNVIQDHNCQGFKKDLISYLNSQLPDPHSRGQL
ncbi:uncharacterized protein EDB93DRAFT_1242739 [Suillus bovinus]|uniref:uncharacterized protein n=1 Tax=Suillus bovinus TaxID=48563 RepID=UPI001B86D8A3|nr:uncharacterized protein EDB93DRAFT_1242739 [Suillus bovinus]KAG2134040.1 hypothetical protein EDB93DRAFT_1242739 [Suillus bovinus]